MYIDRFKCTGECFIPSFVDGDTRKSMHRLVLGGRFWKAEFRSGTISADSVPLVVDKTKIIGEMCLSHIYYI
jgi:hypothetical protein